ncbi:stage III sporulation protein AA [Metabacillus sediminilitoris]|jgi:stage III sporulation protein AA|uniref:Stage III sporulation protein AA n=1 Tax=Metabacillus sediminilitoris TaxID=2567941 RepID=A0A4S4BZ16_9BACI|nr:stage III sporulation protein AA [Metabacillus sediminilitoris]QGQ47182.1 stage III sporulation protein AA [Metabacillus sediminilitoris]THF80526.1 stage III sporulation protein AA [Metabacillus sediminilitoris]
MKEMLDMLPESISTQILKLHPSSLARMEEIRIRVMKRVEVIISGKPVFLSYVTTYEDSINLLNELSHYSIYTLEEELKKGYITVRGGHRVGLSGRVITEDGRVKAIRDVTSFNIRIAKEKVGIAERYVPYLFQEKWMNTLIIGPPQTGKTTLLRDFARVISSGFQHIESRKVGIVDERSEIAGCVKGVPQHQLGERIDVLDACPKAEGMMMMIRSMSPDVLIVDEIGTKEDAEAVMEAVHAGVQLFVTVHGYRVSELLKRPTLKMLIESNVFDRFIELSRKDGPGTVQQILNQHGQHFNLERSVT